MGESVQGHSPPCFVLCTGRSAPVLVLLLLLILILILVLVLLVLLLLILVLLIFAGHRGTSFRICDTASVCPKNRPVSPEKPFFLLNFAPGACYT